MSDLHMCVTCGKMGGTCRWVDDPTICMRKQLEQLRPVADAARWMREAGGVFIAARSSDVMHTEWCNAKERVHQTERDLDAALAALDRVES